VVKPWHRNDAMNTNTQWGQSAMKKLYNFPVHLPFVFDADVQFTRKTGEGIPYVEAWRSNRDTIEVCVGLMWAVISADRTPLISALAGIVWIAGAALTVQGMASMVA
jgi:hypothetical protein